MALLPVTAKLSQLWILIYNKVEIQKARNETQRKIVRENTMSSGKRKQKQEGKKRRKRKIRGKKGRKEKIEIRGKKLKSKNGRKRKTNK